MFLMSTFAVDYHVYLAITGNRIQEKAGWCHNLCEGHILLDI